MADGDSRVSTPGACGFQEAVQINGLAVLVSESMKLNPFEPALYVFINRARNQIKIIYYDSLGFCMWQKRLEKHRFVWPLQHDDEVISLSGEDINWLIGGYDIFRFPPHKS